MPPPTLLLLTGLYDVPRPFCIVNPNNIAVEVSLLAKVATDALSDIDGELPSNIELAT